MDPKTVVQAQEGDRDAFVALLDAVGDRLHATAEHLLRDRQLAEDATQDTLLTMWRELPKLRDPDRFEAWAYRILVNTCRKEARRAQRWLPGLVTGPAHEPRAADDMGRVVDRDQLERGFRELSMDHRAVVVLSHYLDLPRERVAEVLGVPVGTVESRLHRALRSLRAAIEADARSPLDPTTHPEVAP
jgi:RNA polymerase sigma-70 factor (ECF subfamily)